MVYHKGQIKGKNMRYGLIMAGGEENHRKIIACVVKYLIQYQDANPLEIELSRKERNFIFDVFYQNTVYEAQTSIDYDKFTKLQQINEHDLIVCLSKDFHTTEKNKFKIKTDFEILKTVLDKFNKISKFLLFDLKKMEYVGGFK
jgi:hypothetical protein